MRILAIDPGTTGNMGFAMMDSDSSGDITFPVGRYPQFGIVQSGTDPSNQAKHFAGLWSYLSSLCDDYRPDHLAIETAFVGFNPASALKLSEGRGLVITLAGLRGIKVYQYQPTTVKFAVAGHNKADKEEVAQSVLRLLELSGEFKADVTDALAIGFCHSRRYKSGGDPIMEQNKRRKKRARKSK